MGLAEIFDTLGQSIMPQVANAVFPDLLDVLARTETAGSGGGQIVGDEVAQYYAIPCVYEPQPTVEVQDAVTGRFIARQRYLITLPSHDPSLNIRIDLDPTAHRFRVHARGNEPEKIFRILAIQDLSGVVFKVPCERENV